MPFTRPTLQQIVDRTKQDARAVLGITTILRRSFLDALTRAIAGAAHLLHGHMTFISKQLFPDQAEQEYLERWAGIYGIQRTSATFAQLTIDVVFTGAGSLPVGTVFERSDGVTYTVDEEVTASVAGTLQAQITAEAAGQNGNIDVAELVSLQSPISNINSEATVAAIVTEAEDLEDDDSLRDRLLNRIQQAPAGGTANDYIQTALSVAGVTRAWVTPNLLGEGTVVVYFVEDDDDPIIPDAAKIAEVFNAIESAMPLVDEKTVLAPSAEPLNMTIKISPFTATVQAAITSELQSLIRRESQVAGSYRGVGLTYDGKIAISKIREAISQAPGEEDNELVTPTADVIPTNPSGLVTLGTITFQPLV